jgi:hypothetical protein
LTFSLFRLGTDLCPDGRARFNWALLFAVLFSTVDIIAEHALQNLTKFDSQGDVGRSSLEGASVPKALDAFRIVRVKGILGMFRLVLLSVVRMSGFGCLFQPSVGAPESRLASNAD